MSQSERKFYLHKIVVKVLSEDGDCPCDSLEQLGRELVTGDLLGTWENKGAQCLGARDAARLARAMGSEPEWLGINDKGEET